MGVKKFIDSVIEFLNLDSFKMLSKKKSIKNLLRQLRNRRAKIYRKLKENADNSKKKKELLEELEIIAIQIKKGKKILDDLDA
ncbi:hypothetical protein KKG72_11185 [bacterium]|nr:hypothetical protein [bacterium]MBU1993490.1 hypothetical protein [bacterium]